MLVGLYILTPLLRKITESKETMKYFLILSLIVNFIIPSFLKTVNILYFENIYNTLGLNALSGYAFYYILGYYLSVVDIKPKFQNVIYFLGIVGVLSTIIFTIIISKELNVFNTTFYENFSITVLFPSIAIYVFFKYSFNNNTINEKLLEVSKYCFGIYLSHALIIDGLNIININSLTISPLFAIPILSIFVFIISFIISYLLNRIPIINKYFV